MSELLLENLQLRSALKNETHLRDIQLTLTSDFQCKMYIVQDLEDASTEVLSEAEFPLSMSVLTEVTAKLQEAGIMEIHTSQLAEIFEQCSKDEHSLDCFEERLSALIMLSRFAPSLEVANVVLTDSRFRNTILSGILSTAEEVAYVIE